MRAALLSFSLTFCAGAHQAVAQPVQAQAPARADRLGAAQIRQIRQEALVRLIQPGPIDPAALDAIPEQLGFNEEARADWQAKCEAYHAAWRELAAEASARSSELRLAAYEWNDLNRTFEARPVSELLELHESSMTVHRALRMMESDLLGDLPLLANSDRLASARSIIFHQLLERSWRPLDLAGADVDMTRLMLDLELEEDLLASLESRTEAYRNSFGEASTVYAELFDDDAVATAQEIVELGPLPEHASTSDLRDEVEDDREIRAMDLLEQATRMRTINQEYLERVRAMLPPEKALELLRAWRMALGGSYLAEHMMLLELATDIATIPELDAEDAEAIRMVPQEVADRNATLDARIIDQTAAVESIDLEPPTADRDVQLLEMEAELLRMQVKRRATLLLAIRTISGILGSDAPPATQRLLTLQKQLDSRSKADLELAKRSEERSREIEARLAWEEEERLVLESLAQEQMTMEQENDLEENPQ